MDILLCWWYQCQAQGNIVFPHLFSSSRRRRCHTLYFLLPFAICLICTIAELLSATCAAQEARFDRHFVRDLTWSRHQLEELVRLAY